jgi:methyl-accepting chemotaxis protein
MKRRGLTSWWPRRRRPLKAVAECPVRRGTRALDEQVLRQLQRAVGLSETQALQLVERVGGLRRLSARLVQDLQAAGEESAAMQSRVEHNASVITQLAAFIEELPRQMAEQREHFQQLVDEVKKLATLTETIRGIARQTEILAINAAVEAARAGTAGKGFGVLAGEVRVLASESNVAARSIEKDIKRLVDTVERGYNGAFEARRRDNEVEAGRLGSLTRGLEAGQSQIHAFYRGMIEMATEHNLELDRGLGQVLDTAQYQDVIKQIVDRLQPAFDARDRVTDELIERTLEGHDEHPDLAARATGLCGDYLSQEALHRDPEAAAGVQPGSPAPRIELF